MATNFSALLRFMSTQITACKAKGPLPEEFLKAELELLFEITDELQEFKEEYEVVDKLTGLLKQSQTAIHEAAMEKPKRGALRWFSVGMVGVIGVHRNE